MVYVYQVDRKDFVVSTDKARCAKRLAPGTKRRKFIWQALARIISKSFGRMLSRVGVRAVVARKRFGVIGDSSEY